MCKLMSYHIVIGFPQSLKGKTFTVPDSMVAKAFFGEKCKHGIIHSVVRRVGGGDDIFLNSIITLQTSRPLQLVQMSGSIFRAKSS